VVLERALDFAMTEHLGYEGTCRPAVVPATAAAEARRRPTVKQRHGRLVLATEAQLLGHGADGGPGARACGFSLQGHEHNIAPLVRDRTPQRPARTHGPPVHARTGGNNPACGCAVPEQKR
jgi:hypothetical protein